MNANYTLHLTNLMSLITPKHRVAAAILLRDLLTTLLINGLPSALDDALTTLMQPPKKRSSPGRPPHPNLAVTVVEDRDYQLPPGSTYVGTRQSVTQFLKSHHLPKPNFHGRTEVRYGVKGLVITVRRVPADAPGTSFAEFAILIKTRQIY